MGNKRPEHLNCIPYDEFRKEARTGLIGLHSGNCTISRLIQNVTDSDYSHALMIGWGAPNVLAVAEAEQPVSRIVSARSHFREAEGRTDIYRLKAKCDLFEAWSFMFRFSGQDYPEDWIVNNWVRIRLGQIIPPIPNSDDPEFSRHCSGAIAAAFRVQGVPPLKPFDSEVQPSDWADSDITEYVCTPIWS